MNKKEAEII